VPDRSENKAGRRPNGSLEAQVLAQLRRHDDGLTPGAVREAIEAEGISLAYTTVLTILTRLWDKGAVMRTPAGRAYRYRAVQSEAESVAEQMRATLDGTPQRKAALANFVSNLSPRDERLLRDLMHRMDP
jgi:predicted transcriptional regulator